MKVEYCKGHPQYYNRIDGYDKNGTYIRKKEQTLAYALAQKEYDIKVIEAVTNYKRNLEHVLRIIGTDNSSNISAIYDRLSEVESY